MSRKTARINLMAKVPYDKTYSFKNTLQNASVNKGRLVSSSMKTDNIYHNNVLPV